jgi:hypothetical protein
MPAQQGNAIMRRNFRTGFAGITARFMILRAAQNKRQDRFDSNYGISRVSEIVHGGTEQRGIVIELPKRR